jgi:hypothetical protein
LCKKHLLPSNDTNINEDADSERMLEALQEQTEMDEELSDDEEVVQEKIDSNEEISDEEELNQLIESEIYPPFLITDKLQNADSVCSSQSHSTDDVSIEDQFCINNQDVMVNDDDDNHEDDNEYFSNVVLPTTDASKIAHWMKNSIATSIPLSVLLNKHLHLLV